MPTATPSKIVPRSMGSEARCALSMRQALWSHSRRCRAAPERFRRRKGLADHTALAALSRILRRVMDVVFVVIGLAALLRHFDVDPTPTLAGIGVGGIAVALAAQLLGARAIVVIVHEEVHRVRDVLRQQAPRRHGFTDVLVTAVTGAEAVRLVEEAVAHVRAWTVRSPDGSVLIKGSETARLEREWAEGPPP